MIERCAENARLSYSYSREHEATMTSDSESKYKQRLDRYVTTMFREKADRIPIRLWIRVMMVYSHIISIAGYKTVGGAPCRWEEVAAGSANDPCRWEVFLETCKEIGYDGYPSHEQCSPIAVKSHRLGDIAEIDRRYGEALGYLKELLKKLNCYGSHQA